MSRVRVSLLFLTDLRRRILRMRWKGVKKEDVGGSPKKGMLLECLKV